MTHDRRASEGDELRVAQLLLDRTPDPARAARESVLFVVDLSTETGRAVAAWAGSRGVREHEIRTALENVQQGRSFAVAAFWMPLQTTLVFLSERHHAALLAQMKEAAASEQVVALFVHGAELLLLALDYVRMRRAITTWN